MVWINWNQAFSYYILQTMITAQYICRVVQCPHRLQAETTITKRVQRVQHYMEQKYRGTDPNLLCRIYIRMIEHLYYKVGSSTASRPPLSLTLLSRRLIGNTMSRKRRGRKTGKLGEKLGRRVGEKPLKKRRLLLVLPLRRKWKKSRQWPVMGRWRKMLGRRREGKDRKKKHLPSWLD